MAVVTLWRGRASIFTRLGSKGVALKLAHLALQTHALQILPEWNMKRLLDGERKLISQDFHAQTCWLILHFHEDSLHSLCRNISILITASNTKKTSKNFSRLPHI